jgi:penicillin V acylase-like amidase (Ntn superfamily)
MNRILINCLTCSIVAGSLQLAAMPAEACTRCLRVFADGTVVVGRSMDWVEDQSSELWIFPRGMKRQGNAGPGSVEWIATYGSVGVSFYGVATACGMNEKGLVANLLSRSSPSPSRQRSSSPASASAPLPGPHAAASRTGFSLSLLERRPRSSTG